MGSFIYVENHLRIKILEVSIVHHNENISADSIKWETKKNQDF